MFNKIKKERISYQKIIIEIFSVIFAVLIALAVDNYKETRKNVYLAEHTLHQIIQEIKHNKKELEHAVDEQVIMLTQQNKVLELLKKHLKIDSDEASEDFSIDFSWEFAELNSNAWRSATMTQAVRYMDLDTVREISLIYELQEKYSIFVDKIIEDMISPVYFQEAFDAKVAAQYRSHIFIKSMSAEFSKSQLLPRYSEFLENLDTTKKTTE